ncbi:MAG: hypothetical protein JWM09_1364 [Francisellaceae bacterium]|nr:hypothetical protein [Francisellaceae bacterium]
MIQEYVQPCLEWIRVNPTWSGVIVFLISLSESLAVIGLIIPGVALMTAIGAMMGSGVLPFGLTLLWAILGAIAGDGISYYLGHHYKEHLLDFWPFKQFPDWLARGKVFFSKHGGKSIVFGRFVGPVRPMIPVIAGMMNMGPRQFLFFNVFSAIVWAPLYSLPGILIGASLGNLSKETASKIGLLIVISILLLWIIYTFLFKLISKTASIIEKQLDLAWNKLRSKPNTQFLASILLNKQTQTHQFGLILIAILSFVAFIINTYQVRYKTGIFEWNLPIHQVLKALYHSKFIHDFNILTSMADPNVLIPTSILIGIYWTFKRHYRAALCWTVTIVTSLMTGNYIKFLIKNGRPDDVEHLHNFSYPSLHVLGVTVVLGLFTLLINHEFKDKPWRHYLWYFTIPFIIVIGFSRMYLDMHWFTDILGGFALGTFFASLGFILYRNFVIQNLPVKLLLNPFLVGITICYSLFMYHAYPKFANNEVRSWPIERLHFNQWWDGEEASLLICRHGALKKKACVLNLQWLGNLSDIKKHLVNEGWTLLPSFSWTAAFQMLDSNPSLELAPIPEFHRDRLPVLIAVKETPEKAPNSRLLIEMWNSDLQTADNTQLWLGLIREENLKKPLPLIKLYRENKESDIVLHDFYKDLTSKGYKTHLIQTHGNTIPQFLLINSPKT